jgi:hypothetical protein
MVEDSAEPTTTMLEPLARMRRTNCQAQVQHEGEVQGLMEGNVRMPVEEKTRESVGSAATARSNDE